MERESPNVLLVEANPEFASAVIACLHSNYTLTVETVDEAQHASSIFSLSDFPYRIVAINDWIPRTRKEESAPLGLELAKQVKVKFPTAEAILYSGLAIDVDRTRMARGAGVVRCLSEILRPEELAYAIHQVIDSHRLRGIEHENLVLEQLIKSSSFVFSPHNPQAILEGILSSVHGIGFDRVRLYLLSDDRQLLIAKAHIRMADSFLKTRRALSEDRYMQLLLRDPRPHLFGPESERKLAMEYRDSEFGVHACACVPLVLHGRVIGKLAVDNIPSGRPIIETELTPLVLFVSQAASMIENTRLIEISDRRAKDLSGILQVTRALSLCTDIQEIFNITCQSAVELIGACHSGLVIFDRDLQAGTVRADYPALGIQGHVIPLQGVDVEQRVLDSTDPIEIRNVASEVGLGPVRDLLLKLGIHSILFVPVIGKSGIIGSFSLDAKDGERHFTQSEIQLSKLLASHVAVAIDKAEIIEEKTHWADQLEALRRTTLAMTSAVDRDTLLNEIIKQAVELLRAKSGGIYANHPEVKEVTIIADYKWPDHIGVTLKYGEGIAGRLIQSGEPSFIVDDYDEWPDRPAQYFNKGRFSAVLEVPMTWKSQNTGILYINTGSHRHPMCKFRAWITTNYLGIVWANRRRRFGSGWSERGIIVGTAPEVIEQLKELEEVGCQRVMLQWLELDDLDRLEALARRVLPHFQEARIH